TLAGETVAQRGVELGGFQWIVSICSQFESGPNNVGAAACGHHFFMCGDERGAHDAALFKAAAAAGALLEVAEEPSIFERKRKHRLKWKLKRTIKILAQMTVDFVSTIRENFSRIENILGIEGTFDFAHHLQQLVAKLVAHIFGARDAHAMLGGKRTFELT